MQEIKVEEGQVSIVLVGIGGYANSYISALLGQRGKRDWCLVGVVDPLAEKAPRYGELKAMGLPFYNSLEMFYASGETADLAIICSPIQFHCQQACWAMKHGSNVLCEKPAAAVIDDALEMKFVSNRTHRFCAIGYQWSYSPQILALKDDIRHKRYGAAKRLRSLALWARNDAYYHRNNWAGAQKTADGEWILDSPVNNATAHYLHNMLFVLGPSMNEAARPITVQAELYRANPITNYDTAAVRVFTEDYVELLFYTAHPVPLVRGPEFIFEFERGVVTYSSRTRRLTGRLNSGEVIEYGNPVQDVSCKLAAAIRATKEYDRSHIVCDINTAMMHTIVMNGAQQSVENIVEFPARDIYKMGVPGAQVTAMEGLAQRMVQAYEAASMPFLVARAPWSRIGKVISLKDYDHFPKRELFLDDWR